MRGLGDLIARGTDALGIKPTSRCGCKKRQATLNRWVPFHRKPDIPDLWIPSYRLSPWQVSLVGSQGVPSFWPATCYWQTVYSGNTITANSCSAADVQTAINNAGEGDIVKVPGPCSAAWAGAPGVTIAKGITLDGGGNVTLTSAYSISLKSGTLNSARVTGFIFSNSGDLTHGDISGTGGFVNKTWRIDHNTFSAAGTVIATFSNGPGLIDHNTFAEGGGTESIHNFGTGAADTTGWVDDIVPGGPIMVFVEDNTFTNTDPTTVAAAVQSYYGARTVVRHNTMVFSHVDQHGTPGSVGARWWEVYENTFNTPSVNQPEYITMRAGSGVVWNNHHTGSNSGAGNITFKEEDTGTWPLAFQVGSGINGQTDQHNTCAGGTLNSSPAYVWGNDGDMSVSAQSGVNLNRDLFSSGSQPSPLLRFEQAADDCTTTYGYVPYTYPHPVNC